MNKLSIYALLLLTISFVSCETDIEVNAEPTDITVVYGLIDPLDTVHYVKINKAFLGEGNANDLAADASNYDYDENELNVIVRGDNKSYSLTRVTDEFVKEDGVFDSKTNVLYKFTEPNINKNEIYHIEIDNVKLNKQITAKTDIVGYIGVDSPKESNNFIFWSGTASTGNDVQQTVSVTAGESIGRVQAFLIFNYIEYYTTASGIAPVEKKVYMNLGEKTTAGASAGKLNFLVKGNSFFSNLSANVPDPSTIANFSHREMAGLSIELSVAGNDLSTYMEAKAPSTTVNQNKPSFTNITNGIGIFSSRSKLYWVSLKDADDGLNMDTDTKRYLGTLGLGFCLGYHSTATVPCTQL